MPPSASPTPPALPSAPTIVLPEPLAQLIQGLSDLLAFALGSPAFGLLLLCALFLFGARAAASSEDVTEFGLALILGFGLLVAANTFFELGIAQVPSFGSAPDWRNAPLIGPLIRGENPFQIHEPERTPSPLERRHERDAERFP